MHGFLLNTKRLKRMAVCVLSAALLISLPVYAGAKSKKTDTQQKLEDTQNQINSLNEQMQDAQSQMNGGNDMAQNNQFGNNTTMQKNLAA